MALPNSVEKEARSLLFEYCKWRVPEESRKNCRLTYEIHGNEIMLREGRNDSGKRGDWRERDVALFCFSPAKHLWTLRYHDRKKESWRLYPEAEPMEKIEGLVRAVEADDMGLFWEGSSKV